MVLQVQKPGTCGLRLTSCQVAATCTDVNYAARLWHIYEITIMFTSLVDTSAHYVGQHIRAATTYVHIVNSNIPVSIRTACVNMIPQLCQRPWRQCSQLHRTSQVRDLKQRSIDFGFSICNIIKCYVCKHFHLRFFIFIFNSFT